MNNYDFLGLGLGIQQNDLMYAQRRNEMQGQAYNTGMYFDLMNFNAMSVNANVCTTKSPYEIAKEVRDRTPSMQVKRIISK